MGEAIEDEEKKASELVRMSKAGILIRLDGTAEVYYIDEDSLKNFKMLKCFQIRGEFDESVIAAAAGVDKADLKTGDELQCELNDDRLFRRTNLLNAIYCERGAFVLDQALNRVETAAGLGKNHKPITRFPSF